MKVLTRAEQRTRATNRSILSIQLWAHLNNLVDEILAGDASRLSEFQQFIQYAPDNLRMELLNRLP